MSRFNRMVSALVVGILVLSVLMIADLNVSALTYSTLPFDDDFNYPVGNTPGNFKWSKTTVPGVNADPLVPVSVATHTIVRKDPTDNDPGNNCHLISVARGNGTPSGSQASEAYLENTFDNNCFGTGKTILQFKVKMDSEANYQGFNVYFRNGSNSFSLLTLGNNKSTCTNGTSGAKDIVNDFIPNEWYWIRIVITPPNGVTSSSYSVYITDQSGTNFSSVNMGLNSNFSTSSHFSNNTIRMSHRNNANSTVMHTWIDDVKIFGASTESTITNPVIEKVITVDNVQDITNGPLVAGTIKARVNVNNYTESVQPVTVALALYEGDRLIDLNYVTKTTVVSEAVLQPTLNIPSVAGNYSLRVFVWNTFADMRPIKEYKELLPES